ncbi:Kiwa anti-phage protein KwaB-like domain-containing protein [Oceanobacillus sp. Castelsardo]|uniref:Kiwa anti-phage protein KwaB-like domain-containing protein n=1 Tax=Oceanobacillus sp. Castelsardo TaxID=1851204 RepID=UPI0018D365C1|nr:Kiwa anti-phage protein KwaB-like domain-containing protein [Oceanobacillus sp. Castelsardo]
MEVNEVIDLIEERDPENSSVRLYFTDKKQSGRCVSYSPSIDADLQDKMIGMVLDTLYDYTETPQMPFSPIGSKEGYIETYSTREVASYREVYKSLEEEVVQRRSPKGPEVSRLNFYCLRIDVDDENGEILIFRRLNKFSTLTRKGFIGKFTTGDFNELDDDLVGIDKNIDLVVYNNEILIINHIGLERVFSISTQYQEKAMETLELVEESNRIENFEAFKEDCLNDKRVTRILTKILMEEGRVEKVFQNFERVIHAIEIFELSIDVIEENSKLVYENKSQLLDFTRVIRDSFYRSIIGEREGVDDSL